MTLSDFRKIILVAVCSTDGQEKIRNRGPCSARIVIIQTTDDEGLSEGRGVGMGTRWIRERFRKENQLGG